MFAYGAALGAALATASARKAVHNADSYRWFATAVYLSSCDWSRIVSASCQTVTTKRGNITSPDRVETDSLKRKSLSERRQLSWLEEAEAYDGDL